MRPARSIARDTTVCSPGAGVLQSNGKKVHAYFADGEQANGAGSHSPPSILTSTARSGVPSVQAAPLKRTAPSERRTARAMIDFTSIGPTLVSRQRVVPSRSSPRMVTYSLAIYLLI